jgi:hypothetical protein
MSIHRVLVLREDCRIKHALQKGWYDWLHTLKRRLDHPRLPILQYLEQIHFSSPYLNKRKWGYEGFIGWMLFDIYCCILFALKIQYWKANRAKTVKFEVLYIH